MMGRQDRDQGRLFHDFNWMMSLRRITCCGGSTSSSPMHLTTCTNS